MESTQKSKAVIPCLLMLLQGLLYGFGDPFSKIGYAVMPIYSLMSLRYLSALLILMLFAGKHIVRGLRSCHLHDLLPSCLAMSFAYLLGNTALSLTAATSVAFLRSLSIVITPILASVLLHERFRLRHIPVLCFCILGLYLLCARGGLSSFGLGEVFALLTALCLALSLTFGKRVLKHADPLTFTAAQIITSAVLTTTCALFINGGWHLEKLTPSVISVIAYLSIVCTLLGYWLQNAALRTLSPNTVALLQCFCPVMTAFFSFVLLHEQLSFVGICGAAILLLCVVVETRFEQKGS